MLECPFCEKSFDLDEFYEEGRHEIFCEKCDKKIILLVKVHYDYEVLKPDCVHYNNNNHNYIISGYTIYPYEGINIDIRVDPSKWPENLPEKWQYWENYKCTKCDKSTYELITKKEFYNRSKYLEADVVNNWKCYGYTPFNSFRCKGK